VIGAWPGGAQVGGEPVSPPGVLVVRPPEQVFFANATEIRDAVLAAIAANESRPDVVLVEHVGPATADMDVDESASMSTSTVVSADTTSATRRRPSLRRGPIRPMHLGTTNYRHC
jgi:MFS superfamily sulfate permease-like transporter